ncbi:Ig-like domain-containing protein [Cystobacter fuscus]|uniref:Ig-like domain-containing protein n=1 Tax=Cystobacter fuscus TaxID=43 RepID=UPI0037BE73E1
MTIKKRIIPLLLTGWMSACINVPEIEPGRPDAGAAEVPDSGTPVSDLAVSITSPADTFYSSTSVTITVEVRGGVADAVQLLKNGELLAAPTAPPFQYTWDTTLEAEGEYAITARALRSGKSFDSKPVKVVVDRTNLQVASRTPTHGSTNVDYRTPFQVVFTKGVKATTVNDTTVSFAVAGVQAEKTLSLSSDGKTLTITPKERPALPATFSFGLSRGITDLAGNALASPITSTSSPWSFDVPDWYAFGGPLEAIPGTDTQLKDSTMVLDKEGNPIVAWSEERAPGGRSSIFVSRWDGKAFVPMGGSLNGTPFGSAFKASMALGSDGNPIIAWEESDGFNENIYVMRWIGSTWQTVGTGPLSAENDTRSSRVPTPAHNPSLVVKDKLIYVAWDERDIDNVSNIQVWMSANGGGFAGVGASKGRVHAVAKLTNSSKPSLVVDSYGQPIVAFQEQTLEQYSPTNIYVMKYSNASNKWEYAVPPFRGDDTNGYISGGLSATPGGETLAKDCSLAIGLNNNLYLAWSEESAPDGARDIQVFHSTGEQSWEKMGAALSAYNAYTTTSFPDTKVSPTGRVFVGWQEFSWDNDGSRQSFVSTWEGNSWTSLSSANGINYGQKSSIRSTLAVDQSERPVIAWLDSGNVGDNFTGNYIYIRRRNQ